MILTLMAAAGVAAAAPPCAPRNIVLSTDARDGDFNGMSHSGTYLVVRNKGAKACTLPGLPVITFYGNTARSIRAVRQAPRGMHPGPVLLPVTIRAGSSVATALRWVSGPVFDQNRSYPIQAVGMTIAGRPLRTQLRATIFGQAGQAVTFSQAPLATLPPTG